MASIDLGKALGGSSPWLLAGVGAVVLGPRILRLVGRAARPAARTTLKAGIGAYRRTREGMGHLVEESRAEMEHREQAADSRGRRASPARPRPAPGARA